MRARQVLEITADRIADAHRCSGQIVKVTPIISSATLSTHCGGEVLLKAENLPRTGSFKLRGALNKIWAVADKARRRRRE